MSSKAAAGVTRDGRNGAHCFFVLNITLIVVATTTAEVAAVAVAKAATAEKATAAAATGGKGGGGGGSIDGGSCMGSGRWVGEVGVKSPALPNFYFLTNFFFF